MSDPAAAGPPPGAPGEEPELTPEQQEALRQMEEEMRQVRVQDLVTQSTVSILNLAYRRIAKEDERDLEQARVGIDAVAALAEQLEDEPKREIMNALSQVRMAYAQLAQPTGEDPSAPPPSEDGQQGPRTGGAPPGLWVPGSD